MIGGQTVALVMIVRDEEQRIRACLDAARPYIDRWTIIDTGSADRTPDIVVEALDGVPGRLWRRPWKGFAKTRSLSYRKARGSADWLLLLDADMQVEVDPAFSPDPDVDAYLIDMGGEEFSWRLPLLVRGDLPWESRGFPVSGRHAITLLPDGTSGRREITDMVRIRREESHTPAKLRALADDLEADYAANPQDPRTVFYLAQALSDCGDHEEARALYAKRSAMGGWAEEAYYAAYRAALLATDPGQRILGLLAAWQMRPQRIEALHQAVADMNALGMHYPAYLLAYVPEREPDDILFVHRSVWTWGMALERSVAAFHVGQTDEALALCERLLSVPSLPERVRQRVLSNMEAARAA